MSQTSIFHQWHFGMMPQETFETIVTINDSRYLQGPIVHKYKYVNCIVDMRVNFLPLTSAMATKISPNKLLRLSVGRCNHPKLIFFIFVNVSAIVATYFMHRFDFIFVSCDEQYKWINLKYLFLSTFLQPANNHNNQNCSNYIKWLLSYLTCKGAVLSLIAVLDMRKGFLVGQHSWLAML